jgi:type I restriction enzyme M protein
MKYKEFQIGQLFRLVPGHFHARSELDIGTVPLISCGWENNGLIGYYDIQEEDTHTRALTVAFNGAPLTTNFHPYTFGAKDDVAVLVPLKPMADSLLIYIAALLNGKRWRYGYGRKCYREKLRNVNLSLPVNDRNEDIDTEIPNAFFQEAHGRIRDAARASVDTLLSRA